MMSLLSLSLKVKMNRLIQGLCPEWYSSDIITDEFHWIKYCSDCGLVVVTQDLTTIKERILQQEDLVRFEKYMESL